MIEHFLKVQNNDNVLLKNKKTIVQIENFLKNINQHVKKTKFFDLSHTHVNFYIKKKICENINFKNCKLNKKIRFGSSFKYLIIFFFFIFYFFGRSMICIYFRFSTSN